MRATVSRQPCLVGMEACATAHCRAREIGALGHEVRLMPPNYVRAHVCRQKNDAAHAEAICEALMAQCVDEDREAAAEQDNPKCCRSS